MNDEVAEQEEAIEEFIEEHRPILENPDAGHGALSRTYVHSARLITSLGKKSEAAAHRATKATNDLTAAVNDPNCSAGKVDKREKEQKRLLSEHERLLVTFNLLSDFAALVKQRLDNEFDEGGTRIEKPPEYSAGEAEQGLPWWRRKELGGLNPLYSPSRHLRAIADDAIEQGIKDSGLGKAK